MEGLSRKADYLFGTCNSERGLLKKGLKCRGSIRAFKFLIIIPVSSEDDTDFIYQLRDHAWEQCHFRSHFM